MPAQSKIEIYLTSEKTGESDRCSVMIDPDFGKVFSDHMLTIQWTAADGWHDAQVQARAPFTFDSACAVLHYAQGTFEGMKAYRAVDGRTVLFRPEQNAKRFNASAERMAMPTIPEDLFVTAVSELVRVDGGWVFEGDGSLYLRPFMFASEAFLGALGAFFSSSAEQLLCVFRSWSDL